MKNILSALKTLFRFKTYTSINIIGLVLSVAATLIIVRYIHQELTVDHFCKDLNRLYALTVRINGGETRLVEHSDRNNDPNYVNPLKYPEVESYSYSIYFPNDYLIVDNRRYQANVLVTDSMFTELMSYPIVSGIRAVSKPDDAIITHAYARKIFGNKDALGKQFTSSTGKVLTVRGIIDEPNTKASLQFDMLVSYNQVENPRVTWSRSGFTLARLAKGTDMDTYNKKIAKPLSLMCFRNLAAQYQIFPLQKLYFDKTIDISVCSFQQGNYDHIIILSAVACMLFLVGIFNFINIYTVIMLKRAREFGVKKVFGASGFKIFRQIYLENVCMTAVALLFIWMVIEITGGLFASVFNIPVQADWKFDVTISLLLLLGLPLLTSIYPFLRYNYSSPITSLRSVNVSGHSIISRVAFLFIQYVITFCLIVVSLYFVRQLHTMLNTDLGYQTKDVIITHVLPDLASLNKVYHSDEEWQQERDREEHDKQVVFQKMNESPLFLFWQHGEPLINPELQINFIGNNSEKHKMAVLWASEKYMHIFGIRLKEGRTWNDSIDQFTRYKVIINETAQRLFQINNIEHASLQSESRLWWSADADGNTNPPFQVVGVVKDFRAGHFSRGNIPFAILFSKDDGNGSDPLLATIIPGKRKEAIDFLRSLHNEIVGEGDFSYTFMEDEIAKLYEADKRITNIYVTFAGLTIFISCLGLLGLSLYDIRQRYREIALRKVNGATGKQITLLLLRKYLYILGASFMVSIPLAYYIINDYTKDFAVKAPIGVGIFLIALLITLIISLGTLLWQVRKAVHINPGLIMKNE